MKKNKIDIKVLVVITTNENKSENIKKNKNPVLKCL